MATTVEGGLTKTTKMTKNMMMISTNLLLLVAFPKIILIVLVPMVIPMVLVAIIRARLGATLVLAVVIVLVVLAAIG